MKKLFVVLLSTLLLISVTACSSSTSAENSTQKGSKYAPGVYSTFQFSRSFKYRDLSPNDLIVLGRENLVLLLPDNTFIQWELEDWLNMFDTFFDEWERNGKIMKKNEGGQIIILQSMDYFERLLNIDAPYKCYDQGTWEESSNNEIKLYGKKDQTMKINQNYWQVNINSETDIFKEAYGQYKR